uniref:Laccase n=2 Tax=Photinus pyralis TaxID=7054 RepID=A0A1Y1K8C1_PHOPY
MAQLDKVAMLLLWIANSFCYSISEKSASNNKTKEFFEYVLLDESKHPCTRTCTPNGAPMVCRYQFKLEWYQTLSKACFNCPYSEEDCRKPHCIPGDGNRRPVLVVNRQMPGPAIEVCLGDEIVIDVHNDLIGETTSLHFHGYHQRDTPYMDGVPFVTQCPIQPGTTFRYNFMATQAGTHFWHSHTGFQRADGAFGAFIVRTIEEDDPHSSLYDYDLSSHTISILDWGPGIGTAKFVAHHHSNGDNKADTLLVNGLGRFKTFTNSTNHTIYTPTARFTVERGYRYRFRIINAGFLNCPIEVSVDNHTLTVIGSDGSNFASIKAESIVTYAGERFDFIINADQPVDLYWIRFKGLMDCDERFRSAHQAAVLQYKGSSKSSYPQALLSYAKAHKEGMQINALNKGPGQNNSMNIMEMQSLDTWDSSLKEIPDYQFVVSYDFYRINNPRFHKTAMYGYAEVNDTKQQLLTPQLNYISLKLPPVPLLPARDLLDTDKFCNRYNMEHCEKNFCECTHVLEVPLRSTVELIIIDKGFVYDANHPFHLHGHTFRVVAMDKVGANVTEEQVAALDKKGLIKRNLINAIKKDTVTVPDGGYTILRILASNPGYWLFHCHIEFHMEIGMALVLKVGEHHEMAPVPENFPKCGDFVPKDRHSKEKSKHCNWLNECDDNESYSSAENLHSNKWLVYIVTLQCVMWHIRFS